MNKIILTTISLAVAVTLVTGLGKDAGANTLTLASGESDLSGLIGEPVDKAEQELKSLGYILLRTDGLTKWWFNDRTGSCARFETSDGTYSAMEMLESRECRRLSLL